MYDHDGIKRNDGGLSVIRQCLVSLDWSEKCHKKGRHTPQKSTSFEPGQMEQTVVVVFILNSSRLALAIVRCSSRVLDARKPLWTKALEEMRVEDRATDASESMMATWHAAYNLQLSLVHVAQPTKTAALNIGRFLIKLACCTSFFSPLLHQRPSVLKSCPAHHLSLFFPS
jgi:hypothetical protein